jgi:cyclophilin family peptidyl-prolyl cis-trans isomerase
VFLQGHNTVKGTDVHKLQPRFAAFGGRLPAAAAVPTSSCSNNRLQHSESGLLSVHRDGTHFALTLGRALALDSTYTVIGRVGKGADILSLLNEIPTDIVDVPEDQVTICQCGTTDHRGLNESLSAAVAGANVSAGDAAAAAKGAMAQAAAGVKDALAQGLKRKAPEAGKVHRIGKPGKRRFGELSDANETGSEDEHSLEPAAPEKVSDAW